MKYTAKSFKSWISERVEYHTNLNPSIWKENQLDPEIRTTLLKIAKDFWETLKLNVKVIDVHLTGSLANFNWNADSDLDVHIIIDFSQVDTNTELVRKALDGQRFIWNQRHNITIKDHEVECYVQDVHEQHIATGLFSILHNSWIKVPKYNKPEINDKDITEKMRVIKSELAIIKKRLSHVTGEEARLQYEYLDKLKSKIMKDRKTGLASSGEFSIENLVFKELRRDGTIEDIITTLSELYSKIYSI